MPVTPHTITFLDTETTETHPLRRRPWEIALIQRVIDETGQPDRPDREILIHVTDVDLRAATRESLDIGRFYERHVDQLDLATTTTPVWRPPAGPAFAALRPRTHTQHVGILLETINHLLATDGLAPGTVIALNEADAAAVVYAWTTGTHVVGLNPEFDMTTLGAMLARHGYDREPWDYHLTNIATEAAGWLRGQLHAALPTLTIGGIDDAEHAHTVLTELTALPRRSGRLSELCAVEPPTADEAHTALGDARWMRRWWDAITPAPIPAPEWRTADV